MTTEEILDKIKEAEMVLVGLGEEFELSSRVREGSEYKRGRVFLQEAGEQWLEPAWNEYCMNRLGESSIQLSLTKLADLLKDKNYFVVSTATNSDISRIAWKSNRLVMPCGTSQRKQCLQGCGEAIVDVSEAERIYLKEYFERLYLVGETTEKCELGKCLSCGAEMILNNVYSENYNENGYLEQWKTYTKWLQGTVNRKLLILELGVGMQFPSVIRWPFEKVAFYNNKATMLRVNEHLYQMTEELAGKGFAIPKNAIEWITILC